MENNDLQKGKRISSEKLKEIGVRLLTAAKVSGQQAQIVADCFAEADLCGVSTHGMAVLPAHLKKIHRGGYNLAPDMAVVKQTAAFAQVDADNAIGAVSAVFCMEKAIEMSKESGVYTVFCKNANTYGPAFYYPLLAARQGLIGMTFCNSPAAMPVWNGKDRLLGTNPFAVAIPSKSHAPIIFDMATSKVAKSKINEARLNNQTIPDDWALDEHGDPTTDPVEAIRGLMLPMGGFKGYGLALTIDILSGVISGASYLSNVGKFYSQDNSCMDVGQTFIAIDPSVVFDGDFPAVMDGYIEQIRRSRAAGDGSPVLPGDNKKRIRADNVANGIALPDAAVESLNACMVEYGVNISI